MGRNYNIENAEKYGYVTKYRLFPSTRGSLALVGFLGGIILILMRVNLSVAIVCMTIDEENVENNSTTEIPPIQFYQENRKREQSYMWVYDEDNWNHRIYPNGDSGYRREEELCPGEGDGEAGDDDETGEFYWDRELRGTINSSFFWGYVLTQVIGGLMAHRFGAKWVIASGVLLLIAASFLSPSAARLSPYGLMAMRFIGGLGSGVYFPCFHHMWAMWAPPTERSILLTFVLSGHSWGSMISYALSGVLCAEIGWEWVFWLYAICGVLWLFIWVIFAFDRPESHPRISSKELEYIKTSKLCEGNHRHRDDTKVPWVKILTSPCVLCIYAAQFCSAWGANTTSSSLPQYMKDILKIDIKQNGFYNSLPPLCKFFMTILFAFIADAIISKKIMSIKYTRKIMQSIAFVIPGLLLAIVGYFDCFSTGLVVTCLTLAEGFTAGTRVGALTNMLDVAPRYAGLLMGVGNTIGNTAGIFAPLVAGALTTNGTQEEWRTVFFIAVLMYAVGFLVYAAFSTGDVQPWALPPTHPQETEESSKNEIFMVDLCNPDNNSNIEKTQVDKEKQ